MYKNAVGGVSAAEFGRCRRRMSRDVVSFSGGGTGCAIGCVGCAVRGIPILYNIYNDANALVGRGCIGVGLVVGVCMVGEKTVAACDCMIAARGGVGTYCRRSVGSGGEGRSTGSGIGG